MDLTIAICVYNVEKYIAKTLESVINQTVSDFNLLIVDDCSTDGTIEIISKYLNQHHRTFELIRQKKNCGIAFARNTALQFSKTKYLLFVDGDDLLDSRIIEKLYNKIMSDADIMAVTCWSRYIDLAGKDLIGGTYLGVKNKEEFFTKAEKGKLFFMPIHTIFDRQLAISVGGFEVNGFPDGRPRFQDYCEELDLWTRMSDLYVEGKYYSTIEEPLYYYRKSDGLSSNHFNMILKMRYTKNNVRRRRAGKGNLTFIEFYNSLTEEEINDLQCESRAADSLRNGVILLKKGNIFKGVRLIASSVATRPRYIVDKIKNNFLK